MPLCFRPVEFCWFANKIKAANCLTLLHVWNLSKGFNRFGQIVWISYNLLQNSVLPWEPNSGDWGDLPEAAGIIRRGKSYIRSVWSWITPEPQPAQHRKQTLWLLLTRKLWMILSTFCLKEPMKHARICQALCGRKRTATDQALLCEEISRPGEGSLRVMV